LAHPFVRVQAEAIPSRAVDGGCSNPIAVVVHAGGARIDFYGDPVEMFARTVAGLFRRC
jgi:porphobilinogen deaminase